MSKFQQRHYEAIAEALQSPTAHNAVDPAFAEGWHAAVSAIKVDLAEMFQSDNYHFMRDRFMRACEPGANVKARTK